ncbi:MAG: hypothetical protein ACRDBL_09575 [Rhabdaerophilum sp.]
MNADPSAAYWEYPDLEALFGTTRVRHCMREWEAQGFPAPLPWRTRRRRWNPAAVLAWKQRQEARLPGNAPPPPSLRLIERRA